MPKTSPFSRSYSGLRSSPSSIIIQPLWIFILALLYLGCTVHFGYNFLLSEELHLGTFPDDQQEDASSWIKQTLLTGSRDVNHPIDHQHYETSSQESKIIFSQPYRIYSYLENYCHKKYSGTQGRFDKLVLFIIDALRVDFVKSIHRPKDLHVDPLMFPYMEKVLKTNGIGLISIASIPTVTLPRIKALITGTLPSFMDYFLNLNTFSTKQDDHHSQSDNIVEQFAKTGKRVVFYGDDTWLQMFPESSKKTSSVFSRVNVTSSLFATDYTEVDHNVTYNLNRDLRSLNDWDVMILHYLGVDHIGHLRGFHSDLFPEKLHEMDTVFRNIFDTLTYSGSNDSYLIVVTGDHGMTNSGNHGGDTIDETNTAMMFFSTDRNHFQDVIDTRSITIESVLQIDFASTITSLFGLKFPRKNQGRIISSVLERFEMSQTKHLCLLFQNSLQTQMLLNNERKHRLEESLRKDFVQALNHHWQFIQQHENVPENSEQSINEHYQRSKQNYHRFMQEIQHEFVHQTTERSVWSALSLAIILSFSIIIILLSIEYRWNRSSSILFIHFRSIQTFFGSFESIFGQMENDQLKDNPEDLNLLNKCFLHLRYFNSSFGTTMVLLIVFLLRFILIGSVNFQLNEHLFWYYSTLFLLTIQLLICIRGYLNIRKYHAPEVKTHCLQTVANMLAILFLFKLLTFWRMPILQDSDLKSPLMDISNWLTQTNQKRILSSMFLISLILIAAMVRRRCASNRSYYFLIASFIFTYLYRSQVNQVTTFRLPLIYQLQIGLKSPNLYAQIVYVHVALIFVDCLCVKIQIRGGSFPKIPGFGKISRIFQSLLPFSTRSSMTSATQSQNQRSACFLYTFNTVWVVLSTLLMEPSVVPVLMFNVLMEQSIHFVFSAPGFLHQQKNRDFRMYGQLFYRLSLYMAMSYSSFYQIGNRNSLSTIGVNSCFIGMNSYWPMICGLFMIVSIYSTFIYWLMMFFIRLQEDYFIHSTANDNEMIDKNGISIEEQDETFRKLANRNRIVKNYRTFYSIIIWLLTIQFSMMSMDMLVTMILRDHLFIWSIVSPKFIYEFCFTVIYSLFTFLMFIFYTLDNSFFIY